MVLNHSSVDPFSKQMLECLLSTKHFTIYAKWRISSVQLLSRVWLFATQWTAAPQASLSITNSRSPPKPMYIELVMPSNHLILCLPLLLLPSIFPSIRVFSSESVIRTRWPNYWSFSFNISPSSEHPGLISFRMAWVDPLAVQGTLKSLLQNHSSKVSILRCSAFFIVQLPHPYMTAGKTIALTRQTFVDKVTSLLFNMPSMLVITFLPRSKNMMAENCTSKVLHIFSWFAYVCVSTHTCVMYYWCEVLFFLSQFSKWWQRIW